MTRPDNDELNARLEDLALSAGDPRTRIAACFKLIADTMKSERGFVLIFDGSNLKAYTGCNVDVEMILIDEEVSQTIINTVLETKKPILTTNAMKDPRFSDRISVLLAGLRSVISVPLESNRGFFGLIYLDNRMSTGFYKESDRDYLTGAAKKFSEIMERLNPSITYR